MLISRLRFVNFYWDIRTLILLSKVSYPSTLLHYLSRPLLHFSFPFPFLHHGPRRRALSLPKVRGASTHRVGRVPRNAVGGPGWVIVLITCAVWCSCQEYEGVKWDKVALAGNLPNWKFCFACHVREWPGVGASDIFLHCAVLLNYFLIIVSGWSEAQRELQSGNPWRHRGYQWWTFPYGGRGILLLHEGAPRTGRVSMSLPVIFNS